MKYWTTQSGERLLIKDMTTGHITNCIRILEKLLLTKPEPSYAPAPYDEMEDRANDDIEENIVKQIRIFKKELSKR